MRLHLSHTIAQPAPRVFALLSDPRRRPEWQASITAVDMLDAGEPRVGMRWSERPHGVVRFAMQITAFERDRIWAEQFESPLVAGSIQLGFEPASAAATELDVVVTLELRGPLKWTAPLTRVLLSREVRRDLRRAEQVLER